ncbi:MAG: pilus assembly protein PilM, partial [Candidatus Pacebacteria bacterium]|nr:pilus assembly protein PilM [Candidatus Paceibacterota bacterium]
MGKRKTKERKKSIKEGASAVFVEHEGVIGQQPDKETLSQLIEEATEKMPEHSKEELRKYLLEETYFIIGTGVQENVIERLILRTIDIFNVFQKEKCQKEFNISEIAENSQETFAAKVVEEEAFEETEEQEVVVPEVQMQDNIFDEESGVEEGDIKEYHKKNSSDIFHKEKAKRPRNIAIDISDYSIEILQLDTDRHVVAHGRVILESGIVEDGEIFKREELTRAISTLFTKTRPRPINPKRETLAAALSFPESKTFIHQIVLSPDVDKRDLKNEVQKKISQFIPFSPEDMLWDYRVLSEDKEKIEVLYVGVVRILAEEYRSVLEEAGAPLALIDTELSSVGNLLLSDEDHETGTVVIDIGARTMGVGIFDEYTQLLFSVLIPYGGDHMTQEIMRSQHLTYSEAENLKRILGFDMSRGKNDITLVLKKHFEKNIKDIKKALSYYKKQTGGEIRKIILAGGGSLLPDIDT